MRGRRRRGSLVPCALASCDVTVCMFGVGYGVALCFSVDTVSGHLCYVQYCHETC